MRINRTLFYLPLLFYLATIHLGCFAPNGYFTKDIKSKCVFINLNTMQIEKKCSEERRQEILAVKIEVIYDSVQLSDSVHSRMFTLFESKGKVNLPFFLDTIIRDKRKNHYIISLGTNYESCSYVGHIGNDNRNNELIPFTYFFPR
ncbi:MAG: hypothetical protein QM737_08890 [Ferruginibacter sp.]